jgi:NADH-quinone oxidoreductase subunit G
LAEAPGGRDTAAMRRALTDRELGALMLLNVDPARDLPGPAEWDEALTRAPFVVAFSRFRNGSTAHADVVFPAETHAEKEGTVTHPDGRVQRLRPSVPHPGDVRMGWEVLAELSARLGHETGLDSSAEVLAAIAEEVPFYAGITHDEIGGHGVRWQERDSGNAGGGAGDVAAAGRDRQTEGAGPAEPGPGSLRIGTYRDLWAAEVTERSPALRFLAPTQSLELAPADAERLGVAIGDEVDVRSNGHGVRARVVIRERQRPGAGFLIEGTAEANANALDGASVVEVTRVGGAPAAEAPETGA